jgi:glycosyltransferase involved in cell wall biosynthesis
MLAYNHAPFIAQAISSVLAQETTFDYEIVIGEDRSTDDTRAIVCDFAARHPTRIRPLFRERNMGGMRNFISTFGACRGKYTALLDGDDRWTDPRKLQLQVNAMDAHPEWSTCYHRSLVVTTDGSAPPALYPRGERPPVSHLAELFECDFMCTASVMYRRGLLNRLPDDFEQLAMGDWPLHILYAVHGPVGFIDRTMAEYRIHPGGLWSPRPATYQLERAAEMFSFMRKCLRSRYRDASARSAASSFIAASHAFHDSGDRARARAMAWRPIARHLVSRGFPLKKWVRCVAKAYLKRSPRD